MTKVLLVEDDKSLREIYGVRLLAEGYDIVSAGDGEEALAMAIKERPQLIVSDVMMPKISGFDMLDILRSTTETKAIKVIMMTALSSEDQRARGEALGADRYLVKSQVGIEDVVRTVHEVLGDAPVTSASATQLFGGPAPTNTAARPVQPVAPRPVAPAVPQAPIAPAPQSMPQPSAAPTIQQRPQAPQPSFQPAPQPQPAAPSNLPQPTAPFSTTRPANLGDRIIHPIAAPAGQVAKPDLGSLMEQELNGGVDSVSAPAAPPPPPAPQSYSAPQPQPAAPLYAPQPAPAPMPRPTNPPAAPSAASSGISFEETPRVPAPQTPPFTPGAQPPSDS
jgi:two-component system, OmpR family, response regulator RpaB